MDVGRDNYSNQAEINRLKEQNASLETRLSALEPKPAEVKPDLKAERAAAKAREDHVQEVRRKLEATALDFKEPEKATGQSLRQQVLVKQGIDQALAKDIVKALKESKLKVQASIHGDELRVSGKKRDDLQAAIARVKALSIEQPLQFVNFRD